MALHLSRLCTRTPLSSLFTLTRILPQFYSKYGADIIDEFTSELLQRKISKWDQKKQRNETVIESMSIKLDNKRTQNTNIENMTPQQLGLMFQNLIDNEDTTSAINLMDLCTQHNKSPPVSIVISVLTISSQHGDKNMVRKIQELCKTHHPNLLRENSSFKHFLAEAIWVKGDTVKALELFEEVYRENAYLRRRVRLMLKYLISDLVATGSGAAVDKLIHFSERILLDFQDFFPLTCVWQACFLSEWYTDQCVALELLEKHNGLFKSVINRIPYVVYVSLKCHRSEVVYRLLEILLKYKMKQQYSSVLASLLDYQFQCGDLARCAEIIQWATSNDVPLPQRQYIKMINLVLNQELNTPLAPLEEEAEEKPKCDFKF